MKKLLLTVALSVACVSAFAQGTLTFANGTAAVQQPVYQDVVGGPLKIGGTGWIAQLWYGAQGTAESALLPHPTTATFNTAAAAAGFWIGGARTLDGIAGGSVATVQVRVWNVAAGATWAEARVSSNPLAYIGSSSVFNVTLSTPPATPAAMTGLTSFAVTPVPEPTSFALAGLGAAALMIFRRRK